MPDPRTAMAFGYKPAGGAPPTAAGGQPFGANGITSTPAAGPSAMSKLGYSPTGTKFGTGAALKAPQTTPTYGTNSGPGILQQWFNERASGTDPGWEYGISRANTALNNQYAGMGEFNSGANGQAHSDMLANAMAQREGQLDTMAGGASGERQGIINSMINSELGLAGGQAGTAGQYDTSAANALSTSLATQLALAINKAGVNSQANQAGISNGLGIGKLIAGS